MLNSTATDARKPLRSRAVAGQPTNRSLTSFCLVATLLLLLLFSACGSANALPTAWSAQAPFLGTSNTQTILVQWTQSGTKLSGTYVECAMQGVTWSLSGVVSNGRVTLNLVDELSGLQATLVGTITPKEMDLGNGTADAPGGVFGPTSRVSC